MSVNKYLPHVLVLPEDDANRQLANGFQLDHGLKMRSMQILEEAGGWLEVLNRFKADHVPEMDRNPKRFMVLLIDFDGRQDRLSEANAAIPSRLRERVFVLGAWNDPEELRDHLGNYEKIGAALARDCRDNSEETWAHRLLCHNAAELQRLRLQVRPILFPVG
jgi:hypothetical protein